MHVTFEWHLTLFLPHVLSYPPAGSVQLCVNLKHCVYACYSNLHVLVYADPKCNEVYYT